MGAESGGVRHCGGGSGDCLHHGCGMQAKAHSQRSTSAASWDSMWMMLARWGACLPLMQPMLLPPCMQLASRPMLLPPAPPPAASYLALLLLPLRSSLTQALSLPPPCPQGRTHLPLPWQLNQQRPT